MKVEFMFVGSPQASGNASYPPGKLEWTRALDAHYPEEYIEKISLRSGDRGFLLEYTFYNLASSSQYKDTRGGRYFTTLCSIPKGYGLGEELPREKLVFWLMKYKWEKLIGQGILKEDKGRYSFGLGEFKDKSLLLDSLRQELAYEFEQEFGKYILPMKAPTKGEKKLFLRVNPDKPIASDASRVSKEVSSMERTLMQELSSIQGQLRTMTAPKGQAGKDRLGLGPREMLLLILFGVLWLTQLATCARGVASSSQPEKTHHSAPVEESTQGDLNPEQG